MEVAMKSVVLFLIAAVLTSPLGAQDSARTIVDSAGSTATHLYRSPRRALILGSLIPGAGHIYSGEYFKGVSNSVGTIFTIGGGALVYSLDDCAFALFRTCKPGPDWPSHILGAVSIGVGVWTWISSARDAPRAAERANAEHSRRAAAVKPIIDAPVGPHGDWRVGVEIPW
jgi:hypothetical protein